MIESTMNQWDKDLRLMERLFWFAALGIAMFVGFAIGRCI